MASVKQVARVLPGHRVEIVAPELPEGEEVDVLVSTRDARHPPQHSVLDFVDALPSGPRAFPSWDEYEAHLRREREAWG